MGRSPATIYKYFALCVGLKSGKCLQCDKEVYRGKTTSTWSFIRHLVRHHPHVHEQYCALKMEEEIAFAQRKIPRKRKSRHQRDHGDLNMEASSSSDSDSVVSSSSLVESMGLMVSDTEHDPVGAERNGDVEQLTGEISNFGKTNIWECFAPMENDTRHVRCLQCDRVIKLSGSLRGTPGLGSHLKSVHPDVYDKLHDPGAVEQNDTRRPVIAARRTPSPRKIVTPKKFLDTSVELARKKLVRRVHAKAHTAPKQLTVSAGVGIRCRPRRKSTVRLAYSIDNPYRVIYKTTRSPPSLNNIDSTRQTIISEKSSSRKLSPPTSKIVPKSHTLPARGATRKRGLNGISTSSAPLTSLRSRKPSEKMLQAVNAVSTEKTSPEYAAMKYHVPLSALILQLSHQNNSRIATPTTVTTVTASDFIEIDPTPCDLPTSEPTSSSLTSTAISTSNGEAAENLSRSTRRLRFPPKNDVSSDTVVTSSSSIECKPCAVTLAYEDILRPDEFVNPGSEFLQPQDVAQLSQYFKQLIEVDIKLTSELGISVVESFLLQKGRSQREIDRLVTLEWWESFCVLHEIGALVKMKNVISVTPPSPPPILPPSRESRKPSAKMMQALDAVLQLKQSAETASMKFGVPLSALNMALLSRK